MGVGLVGVQRAGELFADPAVRGQVQAWHAEGVPLLDMVERLGFLELFDEETRAAISGLKPDEVAIIRHVMLAEIARAGDSSDATMPIDCQIAQVTGPVSVSAEGLGGRQVAHVE